MPKWCALLMVMLSCFSCGYARLLRLPHQSRVVPIPEMQYIQEPTAYWYRAGVARAFITPRSDVWLAGFHPKRSAIGVHDNLEVRVLVLVDLQGNGIAFVTADIIGFMRNDVERVRKKVALRNMEIFVMSSHTHSGPDTIGIWGAPPFISGRDEQYMSEVIDIMSKTVFEAISNMRSVKIFAGSVNVSNLSKNIREPEILDTELSILSLIDVRTGASYALLVNFGCHPEVLKRGNLLITADMVGVLRSRLDDALGTTTLFVNGSLGGMVQPNIKWRDSEAFETNEAFGSLLATHVYDAIKKTTELRAENLIYCRKLLKIPLKNKRFILAALFGLMPHRGVFASGGYIETEVGVVRIGSVKIIMVPGEIVPELGIQIKKIGGAGTQIWSLANDEIGYILVKEKFHTRMFKYERAMSVGSDTGPIVMDAAKKLLETRCCSGGAQ